MYNSCTAIYDSGSLTKVKLQFPLNWCMFIQLYEVTGIVDLTLMWQNACFLLY